MLSNQPMQSRDPGHPIGQPPPDQHRPGVVLDLNVVMGLSPVIADKQHPTLLALTHPEASEKTCYDLMDQCSRHDIPPALPASSPPAGARSSHRPQRAWAFEVLTDSRPGQQHALDSRTVAVPLGVVGSQMSDVRAE
jgi:hypothetical protein